MTRFPRRAGAAALAAVALAGTMVVAGTAAASPRPVVSGLSVHRAVYWGGGTVVLRGTDLTGVSKVVFGRKHSPDVQSLSPSRLSVAVPSHALGTVDVRVVTSAGPSAVVAVDRFVFVRPSMSDPIQGGLTARQEQRAARAALVTHHGVATARRSSRWTAAMGLTAVRRAASWLGMPYAWGGGNGSGPTLGVCAHNGGDLDCHVRGFDCSGLALYSWWPYEQLVHSAQTQHVQAGRFHPSIGELEPGDLVFFAGYRPNGIGHVAIYAGHGTVVQAAESGTLLMRSQLADVIASTGPYRGATRPASTGRQGAGPRLHAVTSQVAATGGTVTVTGSNLQDATSVEIGGVRSYRFVSDRPGRLVVRVPAHPAGTVSVAVSNGWGTATGRTTYVAAPVVTSLLPASVPTSGAAVTLNGHGLADVTRVVVAGDPVRFARISDTQLGVTMPAHAAGTVPVIVVSRWGSSRAVPFGYLAPAPVDSSSPAPAGSTAPSSAPSSSAPSAPVSPSTLGAAAGSGVATGTASVAASSAAAASTAPPSAAGTPSASPTG